MRTSAFSPRPISALPLVTLKVVPAALPGAGDAGCASQCPEAPTELYSMISDRIDDAVSARTGQPYAKLPVAKRFQALHEATCSCRREAVASRAKEVLHDSTLRKGDVVMTAEGFTVFEGAGGGPTRGGERAEGVGRGGG